MHFAAPALLANESRLVDIGPLAVLCPLIQKLNIAAIIDRHIPTSADYSHGTVLAPLLAARLQQPTALVNLADWAEKHGAEYLFNIPADKLNDDRLGRALDAFFEHRHAILAEVTSEALRLSHLTLERCHFDTTHLILYGSYDASQPRPQSTLEKYLDARAYGDILMSPAHICRGYLTKYKMLQFGVTSVVDDLGALPIACHLVDGNRTGHVAIQQQYHLLRNTLQLPDQFLLVSDRGTCSVEHFARLLKNGHHGLCAAPWADYGHLFDHYADQLQWQDASYLSREQQRRRASHSSLPLESYRLAVVKHQLVHPITKELLDCRLIFVHSSANAKEAKQRREKNIAAIKAGFERIAQKLVRANPATTFTSVQREIERLLAKKPAAQYFQWQLVPLTEAEVAALPPPTRGYRKQSHRLAFSFDEAAAKAEEPYDGIYVLITTAPLSWSADALFTEYKRQTYVERGHHELKTPIAVTPVFLKTPERVESLVSLLFLALQAYMTLERMYRQSLPANAATAECRMTAERILRTFSVCGLCVEEHSYGELVYATRLSPEQRRILTQLSLMTPSQILQRNLAPPPTS